MRRARLIGLVALGLAAPALAHRPWLLPSATVFSTVGDWVSVDAAASDDLFFADHRAMPLEQIKVWRPDGSAGAIAHGAVAQYRSTFDVQLDAPGTWKIGMTMGGLFGSYTLNGEEKRVGGRPGAASAAPIEIPAGATDVVVTEMSGRNELFVTAGAPTETVFKPEGRGLEMVPVTHPDELVANEPASFRFLIDGKPAAGLKVTAIPGGKRFRDAEDAVETSTGADGVARIAWTGAGFWYLTASATDAKVTQPKATQRRMSYSSTLEVMAP